MSKQIERAWGEELPEQLYSRAVGEFNKVRRQIERRARAHGSESVLPEEERQLDDLRRRAAALQSEPMPQWMAHELGMGPLRAQYWIYQLDGVERYSPIKPNRRLHLTIWQYGDREFTATFDRITFERTECKSDRKVAPSKRPVRHALVGEPVKPPYGDFEHFTGLGLLSSLWVRPARNGGV
jgi:hypothetical protein